MRLTLLRFLALMFLAQILNYFDRVTFAAVSPLIATDFRLSPPQMGFTLGVFFIGYALSCLIGGWMADRLGPQRVLGWSVLAWSFLSALTATVSSLPVLLVVRVLFGFGEGPSGAATTVLVGRWFDRRERATVLALAGLGGPLGGLIATPVAGLLALHAGWRAPFVLTGLLGAAWALAWWLVCRGSPMTARSSVDDGRTVVTAGLLRDRSILALACSFFSYSYLLFFFLSWFPGYLTLGLKLDLHQASLIGAIPWSCGAIGLLAGGIWSDRLLKRLDRIVARWRVIVLSIGGAAFAVLGGSFADGATLAVASMAVAVFLLYLSGSVFYVFAMELSPARPGLGVGFVQFIGNAAGLLAPSVTGQLVGATGDFRAAFLAAFVVAIAGLLALLAGVRQAPRRAA